MSVNEHEMKIINGAFQRLNPQNEYVGLHTDGKDIAVVRKEIIDNAVKSVIEDIKAEIDERWHEALKDDIRFAEGLEVADMIINKHIGKENE